MRGRSAATTAPCAPKLEDDLSGRDVDDKTDAAVHASYLDAARVLEEQIRVRDEARATHERRLLVTIQAYRNISDRTHREIDDTIESLPALEHIHQQLVTGGLPRARAGPLAASAGRSAAAGAVTTSIRNHPGRPTASPGPDERM
ncbi:MAG TPA: hypothetical protein DHU96_17005 [Actinobacteria bacterium]|nr:hypothetical protein [Actinomycetota bacterium]